MKKKMAITLAAASMAVLSAALLTGCGKSGSSPEGGNKEDNKLNVYNWGEYIDEDVITQFEEETGIQVVYDVFETNEEMYPVIEAGAVKYDVVCPSDYMIQRMIENDLLAELNFDNIPNYKEIGQQYLDISKGFDPENKYSVPYCWGTMGILYNTKRLEELGYGEDILSIRLQNFCTIDEIAKEVGGFDFILADLGVSSMQIDNPKRGFSFKVDGPLDLRLNQEKGISAAERLDTISREELAGMLYENSDEPYCEELAKAITEEIRRGNRIDTTTKLRRVIERALDFLPEKEKQETVKKTCQRTFQALRIDVNHEFEVLYEFMEKLPGALKPGGRVAILTFHSGEDRLVKQALKEGYREGIYSDYAKDVIRPSAEECAQNGRARSTKMRWAVRAE